MKTWIANTIAIIGVVSAILFILWSIQHPGYKIKSVDKELGRLPSYGEKQK